MRKDVKQKKASGGKRGEGRVGGGVGWDLGETRVKKANQMD